jgi:hypothetical protein
MLLGKTSSRVVFAQVVDYKLKSNIQEYFPRPGAFIANNFCEYASSFYGHRGCFGAREGYLQLHSDRLSFGIPKGGMHAAAKRGQSLVLPPAAMP